jgi:DNA (cytosine-5)-methyltransferase 1
MAITGRPRVLDLFCGAGGAGMGYYRAGFDVVGVDIQPQKNYPFKFIQDDAMTFPLDGFDLIHASPPCQRYSRANRGLGNTSNYPDLIEPLRERLQGRIYVIENVPGAPLVQPITLCGSMFGLRTESGWLRRHRWFELPLVVLAPGCCHPRGMSIGVYGRGTNSYHRRKLGRNIRVDEQREAMGIDWMPRRELTQAIPPAYTEWIGRRIRHVSR